MLHFKEILSSNLDVYRKISMKAYSLDLRQRILEAYLHSEGSIRDLANVSTSVFRLSGV